MTQIYKLWLVLLVISGGIAAWFLGGVALELWRFKQLNASTLATLVQCEIQDLSSSRYAIAVEYRYEVNGVSYDGKTVFKTPLFLNRYAAENHAKLFEEKRWRTWYAASRPGLSSLEREFPQKECLHALLTVGVFAYFYFSRSMLSKSFSLN